LDHRYLWNRTFAELGLEDGATCDALISASDIRQVGAGKTLIAEADEDDQVYLLLEGKARVVLFSAKGQEIWIDTVTPGSILGEIAALTGTARTSGIVAETPCLVAALTGERFRDLLSRHAALGHALSAFLARRVQSTTRRMFELSALSAKGRVFGELLRLAGPGDEDGVCHIKPTPNLAALAKRVSTTRETVSRAIAELEDRQLLERRDDAFALIDPDQLDRLQH